MANTSTQNYFAVAFGDGPIPMTLTEVSRTKDRVILEANEAMAKLLGYSREELTGMSFVDLTHPDDLDADDEGTRSQTLGDTTSFSCRKRYLRADGELVWVQLHVATLEQEASRVVTVGHAIDVTAVVEAEQRDTQREILSTALSDLRQALLSGGSQAAARASMCRAARVSSQAACAFLLTRVASGENLRLEASDSLVESSMNGCTSEAKNELALAALKSGATQVLGAGVDMAERVDATWSSLAEDYSGTVVAIPLEGDAGLRSSVLVIVGCGCTPKTVDLTTSDIENFGAAALAAIELSIARDKQGTLDLLEDRARIGREIHDRVIGRLFATGMQLQAALSGNPTADAVRERVHESVAEIDEAIKDIRDAIYERK